MNDKLCSSPARTYTGLKIINALNLSLYSYVESKSKLGSQENPFVDKSVYILVSYGTTFFDDACFTYSRQKSRLVHILEMHSIGLIRTRKSQKSCGRL